MNAKQIRKGMLVVILSSLFTLPAPVIQAAHAFNAETALTGSGDTPGIKKHPNRRVAKSVKHKSKSFVKMLLGKNQINGKGWFARKRQYAGGFGYRIGS